MIYKNLTDQELVDAIIGKAKEQADRIMRGESVKNDDCFDSISESYSELKARGDNALRLLWSHGRVANDNARCYVASYCFELFPSDATQVLEELTETSPYPFVRTSARMTLEMKRSELHSD